jgi:two-component system, cell cycle response regulator
MSASVWASETPDNAAGTDSMKRVLIIDDSELDRRIARIHLEREDLEVLEAGDGETGIASALESTPDLILLELRMPQLDGFETIRRLKNNPITISIPVIFLAGTSQAKEKAEGLDLGAVDFVSKPFDPIELRARVRVALRTKFLQNLLEIRAHVDGLTGLGNRHAFEDRLELEWKRCRQRNCPLALVLSDVDNFKRVNDALGHGTGDEILRQAATALKDSASSYDFVGRYGGEEFIVIAPERMPMSAVVMAERFRRKVAGMTLSLHEDPNPRVTVSVGVASTLNPRSNSPEDMLKLADQALYQAKEFGRNAVWYWDEVRSAFQPSVRAKSILGVDSDSSLSLAAFGD